MRPNKETHNVTHDEPGFRRRSGLQAARQASNDGPTPLSIANAMQHVGVVALLRAAMEGN